MDAIAEAVGGRTMPTERMKKSEIKPKLKPCPFCGGEMCIISTLYFVGGSQRRFLISHKGLRNCHFYKFELDPQTVRNSAEAIEAWNRRI